MENETVIMLIEAVLKTLVLPLIIWGISKFSVWVTAKVKNEKVKTALEYAAKVVTNSVVMVSQTYVDELKMRGEFTVEAQEQALYMAIENEKALLNDEIKTIIEDYAGDLDEWLMTATESAVRSNKYGF